LGGGGGQKRSTHFLFLLKVSPASLFGKKKNIWGPEIRGRLGGGGCEPNWGNKISVGPPPTAWEMFVFGPDPFVRGNSKTNPFFFFSAFSRFFLKNVNNGQCGGGEWKMKILMTNTKSPPQRAGPGDPQQNHTLGEKRHTCSLVKIPLNPNYLEIFVGLFQTRPNPGLRKKIDPYVKNPIKKKTGKKGAQENSKKTWGLFVPRVKKVGGVPPPPPPHPPPPVWGILVLWVDPRGKFGAHLTLTVWGVVFLTPTPTHPHQEQKPKTPPPK